MTQQENDELMYASEEDIAFYHKCVEGLPTLAGLNGTGKDADGIPLPYGVGPHSIKCFREIFKIVDPLNILEIGFNMGWSAAIWKELMGGGLLVSCDISHKEETINAANFLIQKYNKGNTCVFEYYNRGYVGFWNAIYKYEYDLIFIDGGHLYEDVKSDIELAIKLDIPYLAFDDILPEFGPGVMPAIKEYSQLELVKEMGNIALYKNTTV